MSASGEDQTRVKPDLRAALAAGDVQRVHQILGGREDVPESRVFVMTGGRKVRASGVLLRVADGLGIPREMVGPSSCCCQVRRLDVEATGREIMAAYERLRAAPVAWQSYLDKPAPESPGLAAASGVADAARSEKA